MTNISSKNTVRPASLGAELVKATRIPGEAGTWLFILGDMTVFAAFFLVFTYERAHQRELFVHSQAELHGSLALLNTVLMLASSWLVATAIALLRCGQAQHVAARCLLLAIGCGLGFVMVKYFEYSENAAAGITLTGNDFYMYYYMFTGIHLLHVLIGLGVLGCMALRAWRGSDPARELMHFESGASFWHMVDLLWIVLAALLYLLP